VTVVTAKLFLLGNAFLTTHFPKSCSNSIFGWNVLNETLS